MKRESADRRSEVCNKYSKGLLFPFCIVEDDANHLPGKGGRSSGKGEHDAVKIMGPSRLDEVGTKILLAAAWRRYSKMKA